FDAVGVESGVEIFSPAKYDLSLFVNDAADELMLQWNYALSLFTEDTIARFAQMYQQALVALLDEPRSEIGKIDLLS
ncbi:condensation domain-containing protein, partial [uncultured Shewanella sp.]|uniref:condensation domain-containing protein n=1 Tax=uncultured Shewanella sp. TaxID=173975 RepID=UPI00260349CA